MQLFHLIFGIILIIYTPKGTNAKAEELIYSGIILAMIRATHPKAKSAMPTFI